MSDYSLATRRPRSAAKDPLGRCRPRGTTASILRPYTEQDGAAVGLVAAIDTEDVKLGERLVAQIEGLQGHVEARSQVERARHIELPIALDVVSVTEIVVRLAAQG